MSGSRRPNPATCSREAERVWAWLEENPKVGGRGLAMFCCTPRGLFESETVAVPVADRLMFDRRADARPLLALFDDYERYAVVLVDKRKARLFTVFLGE